jgi:hypothetical protein
MCDEATQKSYNKKIKKISSNPSQSNIDSMTDSIIKKLMGSAK